MFNSKKLMIVAITNWVLAAIFFLFNPDWAYHMAQTGLIFWWLFYSKNSD